MNPRVPDQSGGTETRAFALPSNPRKTGLRPAPPETPGLPCMAERYTHPCALAGPCLGGQTFKARPPPVLFDLPARFFPVSLTGQRLLDPLLLTRLQVERVPLDLFNDVFLLHLTLEAPKGVFQRFALLEFHFCQMNYTSQLSRQIFPGPSREGTDIIGGC
jgi:hypothetical protein